nr:type II secretion system F family protein [Propionicimonas sp.]
MTVLAAVAAAVACWLALAPDPALRLRDPEPAEGTARSGAWPRRALPGLLVACAAVAGGLGGGGAGAAIAFAAALPAVTVGLVWRRHRSRSAAVATAREVSSACQLLSGLLRVGHVPSAALAVAARDAPELAEAAAVLEVGGPPSAALRRSGVAPGRAGLVELAVAWEVAERTGASLTATLDALAERLAAEQAVADVVAAELAAPRATGRLLAALPAAGLLLGYSFGGDPLGFLAGSLPGQLSLVAGVALGCAGVFWTERIAEPEVG